MGSYFAATFVVHSGMDFWPNSATKRGKS